MNKLLCIIGATIQTILILAGIVGIVLGMEWLLNTYTIALVIGGIVAVISYGFIGLLIGVGLYERCRHH